jgi:hypothetical protein
MIKESLIQLSHELNRLDSDSDTLILVDWKTRTVMLSQRANEQFISNNFWILLESTKESGRSLDMISVDKLKSIKTSLLKVINNFSVMEIVPQSYGFEVKSFKEVVVHGKITNLWTTEGRFKLRNNIFMKIALYVLSSRYRSLRKSLLKVKFE